MSELTGVERIVASCSFCWWRQCEDGDPSAPVSSCPCCFEGHGRAELGVVLEFRGRR